MGAANFSQKCINLMSEGLIQVYFGTLLRVILRALIKFQFVVSARRLITGYNSIYQNQQGIVQKPTQNAIKKRKNLISFSLRFKFN